LRAFSSQTAATLAFSVAMYPAFVERQMRYNRAELAASSTA
jgi:hypothetical protein